jgi:hypothetical protein
MANAIDLSLFRQGEGEAPGGGSLVSKRLTPSLPRPPFFLDAVDVLAPSDTVVIYAFGDSITDGTHSTLNVNDRWMNTLSRRLHNVHGNKLSIVNEAIAGNRVVNPVTPNSTAGPAAVDRLD